jgi:pyruvate dehydrogenase E2 component (dihydrolipoamide acetyltransferase)
MAVDIVMPRLGWGGNEASLVEWSKQDGDRVEVGDIVCLVEGDKVVTEVESIDSGVLCIAPSCPPPGQVVPVGTVLGYLLAPGEAAPFAHDTGGAEIPPGDLPEPAEVGAELPPAAASAGQNASAAAGAGAEAPLTRQDAVAISPRARRVALELGVDWRTLQGSGRSGRIVERDVREAERTPATGARITPLARREAREAGVDLDDLALGKPGQRIRRADVESAAHPAAQAVPDLPVSTVSGRRRLIAERLTTSMRTVAPVTLTTEADATELVTLRRTINAGASTSQEAPVSYNDLLARLVAIALSEHPQLNASLVAGEIVQHATAHIGIAVDTARGLLVPVVRDVATKSIRRIADESSTLIRAARSGRIAADDLRGSTFTITNLGMYEIDAFTPIINLPECAILGVGRIVARPVVVDDAAGTIAARTMMALSLTFDHRIVDGAPAARFLQRVKQFVERPTLWLVR